MVHVQTGNMLDVVVEGKSIGLKPRDHSNRDPYGVYWLPDPESLALVLLAEIKRLRPDSVESKDDRFSAGEQAGLERAAERIRATLTEAGQQPTCTFCGQPPTQSICNSCLEVCRSIASPVTASLP